MRRRRVLAGLGTLVPLWTSGCTLPPGMTWWTECPTFDSGADRTVCSRTDARPDLFFDASAVVYDYEDGPVPTDRTIDFTLKNRTGGPVAFAPGDATVYRDRGGWAAVPTTATGDERTLSNGENERLSVRDAALDGDSDADVTLTFDGTGDYALVVPVAVPADGSGASVAVSIRFRFRD